MMLWLYYKVNYNYSILLLYLFQFPNAALYEENMNGDKQSEGADKWISTSVRNSDEDEIITRRQSQRKRPKVSLYCLN